MRIALCLPLILLTACAGVIAPSHSQLITSQDLMMNRPGNAQLEARFRMFEGGQGTVEFLNGPDGPQPVAWSLRGSQFCIAADEGLIASFGCAAIRVDGDVVSLSHTQSDRVAMGRLVGR